MATITHCTRCKGKGSRETPREHYGVPGMCWDCDGDGSRETQLINQARAREAKRMRALLDEVLSKVRAVRAENGGSKIPPRQRRHPAHEIFFDKVFTTETYASQFGMTKREAWVELCCYTRADPVLGDDGKPVGWKFE